MLEMADIIKEKSDEKDFDFNTFSFENLGKAKMEIDEKPQKVDKPKASKSYLKKNQNNNASQSNKINDVNGNMTKQNPLVDWVWIFVLFPESLLLSRYLQPIA